KIMRRLLREIATSGAVRGDVTTLEDMGVINRLAAARGADAPAPAPCASGHTPTNTASAPANASPVARRSALTPRRRGPRRAG
ncbi:MAG TPA: hypothetical protein VIF57_14990, partial [Polyangia bacterium]